MMKLEICSAYLFISAPLRSTFAPSLHAYSWYKLDQPQLLGDTDAGYQDDLGKTCIQDTSTASSKVEHCCCFWMEALRQNR